MTLYSIYHHHAYGGSIYLAMFEEKPTEQEIVDHVLSAPYEPEKDEWLLVEAQTGEVPVFHRKPDGVLERVTTAQLNT